MEKQSGRPQIPDESEEIHLSRGAVIYNQITFFPTLVQVLKIF